MTGRSDASAVPGHIQNSSVKKPSKQFLAHIVAEALSSSRSQSGNFTSTVQYQLQRLLQHYTSTLIFLRRHLSNFAQSCLGRSRLVQRVLRQNQKECKANHNRKSNCNTKYWRLALMEVQTLQVKHPRLKTQLRPNHKSGQY